MNLKNIAKWTVGGGLVISFAAAAVTAAPAATAGAIIGGGLSNFAWGAGTAIGYGGKAISLLGGSIADIAA